MSTENNGYLDSDQTIVNFAVRELGISFEQLLDDDPNRMLRNWLKCRKTAKGTAIGTTIMGAIGVMGAVVTGATPLLVAGLAVAAVSGLMVKQHSSGAAACETELGILDECRPILSLMVQLERRGANPSDLVSTYDRLIRMASTNHIDVQDKDKLQLFFQRELEQVAVFSKVADGMQIQDRALPAGEAGDVPGQQNEPPNQVEPIGDSMNMNLLHEGLPIMQQNEQAATKIQPTTSSREQASPTGHLIGSRLRTTLIVSVSGGGKDILLSNALRQFQALHPGFRIVVMDCKDDSKEYGYYANLPNVSVQRLNVAIASDGEVVEWVDRCLEEFLHLPEKALLICNEGTLIRAKSKRYVGVVAGLVSSGDSREKYCWEAGQSAHTDDLTINGAARSRFRMLIIGLKGEEMQIEAVLQAKFVAESARNMEDVKSMMIRSPVGRAWSDGQRWFPMPKLDNYSGYDRDSRKTIGGHATPKQTDADRLEQLYQAGTTGTNFVPNSETVPTTGDDGDESGTKFETMGTTQPQEFEPFDQESATKFVSSLRTNETTLFAAILSGFRDGLSPSDIVKDSLKLKRQYQEGKALSVYLVRKYGSFDLLMHYRKWLEEK